MSCQPRRDVGTAIILIGALRVMGCGGDDDDTTGDSGSDGESSNTTSSLAPLTTPPTTAATTTTLAQYYEVQPGDSLSGIAQQFDIRLEDLIAANGSSIRT